MKKLNLLSRAEMKKVMGGMESVEPIDGGGGRCNQSMCSFQSTQGNVSGFCGLSTGGTQCRCIYDGTQPGKPDPASVPDSSCLAS